MNNEVFDESYIPCEGIPKSDEATPECVDYALDECAWDLDNSTFSNILRKMNALYRRKNSDYGDSFKQTMNKFGLVSSIIRLNDKLNRLNNLVTSDKKPEINESIQDTLLDLANYCVMTLAYLEDGKK